MDAEDIEAGWRHVDCPSCGTKGGNEVLRARNLRYGIDIRAAIVECGSCGLMRTDPQPNEGATAQLYPAGRYYTHDERSNRAGPTRATANRLRDQWQRKNLAGVFSKLRFVVERHSDLGRYASRYAVDLFPLRTGQRALDLGCGDGKLLAHLQHLGIDAVGVEVDPAARAIARRRGLRVEPALVTVERRFNRVVMSHVLEHAAAPIAMLAEVSERMEPDGLLLLSVPNARALQAEVFGAFWEGWDLPRHRWHFDETSLAATVERVGLEIRGLRSVEVDGFANASRLHRSQHGLPPVRYAPKNYPEIENSMRGAELVLVAARRG